MTLYRHATGLDRKTLESEMGEILTKKGMEHVFSHETFTLEAWLVLLGIINQRCPRVLRGWLTVSSKTSRVGVNLPCRT